MRQRWRVPYDWPLPNVWLGVSIENQQTADERIPLLLQIQAARRFVSAEPLLGAIDLWGWSEQCEPCPGEDACPFGECINWWNGTNESPDINWLIVGGESGPNARPMHPDWVRSLRDQCVAAGVPFFFKQWGGNKKINGTWGGNVLDNRVWNERP